MSKHDHQKVEEVVCEHELKHCKECDVIECTKCDKEWPQIKTEIIEVPIIQKTTDPYNPFPNSPWYRDPSVTWCAHNPHEVL